MALIPPEYIDAVAAIGITNNDQTQWIGTGFLYGEKSGEVDDKVQSFFDVYLVTNKHVLGDLTDICVRFNTRETCEAEDFTLKLRDGDSCVWVGHPDPEIDVAVIRINAKILQERNLRFNFFRAHQTPQTTGELKKNGAMEGDFVYVMGFPMGEVLEGRQHVFVRKGIISRIQDLFEDKSKDFVIDSFVFPGNSGGPVILKPEHTSIDGTSSNSDAKLIGIVKAYIPYKDVAVSQQTGHPRIIFEENSGLTKVEPVEHLVQTINELKKSEVDSI